MARPVIGLNSDVEPEGTRGTLRVRLPAAYVDAVASFGGLPQVVSPTLSAELLREQVARCDGFLFIGGADYPAAWSGVAPHAESREMHPVRAAADRELMQTALRIGLPILAICGGHQLLNLACGGALVQHLPQAAEHVGDTTHAVSLCGGRLLRGMFGVDRIEVNSWHHQAVRPDRVGSGLVVAARTDDGIIEALEGVDPSRFLLGVQWHPERIRDPDHRRRIFCAFVEASALSNSHARSAGPAVPIDLPQPAGSRSVLKRDLK
jgi:putative glutamine amidotransferase